MRRILRSFLQQIFIMVNTVGVVAGMAFILYGLLLMSIWYREFHSDPPTLPWFIYTFLGLGVSLCLISGFGYIAAKTANGRCISFYMILIFLLVMLEAAITALVILNKDWEEVFPFDTTRRFNEFKNFIRSNVEFCKWVGLTIVTAQGMSIFLALILKALGPHSENSYDIDDSVNTMILLLTNQGAIYVWGAHVSYKSGFRNVR
ncbi:tetraspanin-19-like [Curcuma longa]|uniref:tetraspanin-19-like n=1 Tax=Curcuma longa TaxID=136217 RepID=UPI003D9E6F52